MLHSSRLDLFMACPASAEPIGHPHNPVMPEAALGTAKHKAIATFMGIGENNCAEIAHEAGVDPDDINAALGAARRLYSEILGWFPGPGMRVERLQEVKLETEHSKGTADLVMLVYSLDTETPPHAIVVVDWKSGWSEDEHRYQLMDYADGARRKFGMPLCGYITAVEGQLRHGERIVRNYSAEDLDAFRVAVAKELGRTVSKIQPGKHCQYCPRQLECEQRREYLGASTAALVEAGGQAALTREQLGLFWDRYKDVMRAADRYQDLIDAALEMGPIPLPGGRQLELHEAERTVIDATAIDPLLARGWTLAELNDAVKISKSGIDRIVKTKAPPRGGARMMREVMAELEKADALRKKTIREKVVVEAPSVDEVKQIV